MRNQLLSLSGPKSTRTRSKSDLSPGPGPARVITIMGRSLSLVSQTFGGNT